MPECISFGLNKTPIMRANSIGRIKLVRLEQRINALHREIDGLSDNVRLAYLDPNPSKNSHILTRERFQRCDTAYSLATQCGQVQKIIANLPDSAEKTRLRSDLQLAFDRALRYTRESPTGRMTGPISAIEISQCRNFYRDNTERMYYLGLNQLPSTYDFFGITYVETPKGYQQSIHLHGFSQEVDVVLSGQAECVWYEPDHYSKEAGRLSLEAFQAFRVPAGVVHTIENPTQPNVNFVVKLPMFAIDRIDIEDPRFPEQVKISQAITREDFQRAQHEWGERSTLPHSFGKTAFTYQIDQISPAQAMPTIAREDQFYFLFNGKIRMADLLVEKPSILKIAQGQEIEIKNIGKETAVLISVGGLSTAHFIEHPQDYPDYPGWLLQEIARTIR